MRIIAGAWRGRRLAAPAGDGTRPTADRLRQAIFDRLMHAPYAGRAFIESAIVLDVFAGTGAMGLEALSRGAVSATFIERDRAALAALRANVAACKAADRCRVISADALHAPPGTQCTLVFLDPPYAAGLLAPALAALSAGDWIAPDGLIVIEAGAGDVLPVLGEMLADLEVGPARIVIGRAPPAGARASPEVEQPLGP